jgi:type IV pilus assembly protein PilQ
MRRVCSLVAVAAIALFGARSAGATGVPALANALTQVEGAVTGLSVVPGSGSADVIVQISGSVDIQDFVVPSPHRIVLDLTGARLDPMARLYDGKSRAGIQNIRLAQYRTDVVRVVLDVDGPRDYEVSRDGNTVRISLKGEAQFAAWHSSGSLLGERVAEVAAEQPRTRTVEANGSVDAQINQRANDDRQIDAAVTRTPEPRIERVALATQQSQQPRITVTYADAEIRDVIAAFATFANRTIVAGKDVAGTITAEIKNQPWDVALKAILEAHGLALVEEGSGIITVDSYKNILEKQASEPVSTQMVNINYVSAASLQPTVQGLLYKDCPPGANNAGAGAPGAAPGGAANGCIVRGTVASDSGTNSLIITEVASRLPALLQYVQGLDIRTPQVALKAKIVSLQRTNIEQLGVAYDLGSKGTFINTLLPRLQEDGNSVQTFESQVELGGEAVAGIANAQRKYKGGSALNLIYSASLGRYSLTSFFDALHDQQLSDVQAEPSVVTLDNRKARILVGQETPVRVIDAGSAGQIGQPARANVQFRETGIILEVTPHITSNRQVRMTIRAEQSDLRIVGGDLGFIIDKREALTQALVNNGESAVIAGLTQTQIVKNRSGIPFLGQLPLIGRFFSQTDSREEKRDLVITITPTIIDEGSPVRPPESK